MAALPRRPPRRATGALTASVGAGAEGGGYACRVCGGTEGSAAVTGVRDWEYGVDGEWSYLRCARCGILQLDPFPTVDDLIEAYDVDYHGYRTSAEKGRLYKLLFEIKDGLFKRRIAELVPRGAALLDIGCGSGEYLRRLGFLQPSRTDGIDFNDTAVQLAREKGVDCFQGIFPDFPAEPGTYDALFMNNYLEHTLQPHVEARKAFEVLKPGGQLIGEVPNFRSVDQRLFGRYWGGNHVPRHTYQFEPASLERLLREAGFARVRTKQELSSNHLTLSVQNWLQRNEPDLAANPSIRHGRAWYYNHLLIGLAPVNLFFMIAGRSGVMKFFAEKD